MEWCLNPRNAAELAGRVLGPQRDAFTQLLHSLRPHQCQIHAGGDSPHGGCRAHKFFTFFPLGKGSTLIGNVAEAVFAWNAGFCNAEQARRKLLHKLHLIARSNESPVPSAKLHMNAEALNVTADDVRSIICRRLKHTERAGIGTHHTQRAVRVRYFCDILPSFNRSQVGRVVEIHRGGVRGKHLFQRPPVD